MTRLGFVGLGVMGGPMCANLARGGDATVSAFDLDRDRLAAAVDAGALPAADLAEVAGCDVVFLSLPAEQHVASVTRELAGHGAAGLTVVDMSTSPVALVTTLAAELAERSMTFVDSPVARTRQAAIDGTLAVMVGAPDEATFRRLEPLLRRMASDISHCGPVGAGALTKLLNNMVVFATVVSLAEALTVARRSGLLDDTTLIDVLGRGSAASFTLDHHGRQALLPDIHPLDAFPARYMRKDLAYALAAATDAGVELPSAQLSARLLDDTIAAGHGDEYHTAVVRILEGEQ